MKIVAPASSKEDVIAYNQIGVEEIYLGVNNLLKSEHESNKWNSVNERFERKAKFANLEEMMEINRINGLAKKPAELSLTLNKAFYNESQLERAKDQIMIVKDYIDNFIVSDISLINFIRENAPNNGIILSCIAASLNSETVKFYKKIGIKKVILPRHLSLGEIKMKTRDNPDMEFEVMILNQFCRNIDGFCSRCHIPVDDPEKEIFDTPCNINYDQKLYLLKKGLDGNLIDKNLKSVIKKFNPFCGVCFIRELERNNVDSLKIVGRANTNIRKANDAKFIRKVLELKDSDDKDYVTKCKELFKQYYNFDCENNCYY